MDYSPPGSSVHGILQERIWEWLAMPSSSIMSLSLWWSTFTQYIYAEGCHDWAPREAVRDRVVREADVVFDVTWLTSAGDKDHYDMMKQVVG